MLTGNLSKFCLLSWHDRRLLLQSFMLLPLIHCGLTVLGYLRLRSAMEKITHLGLAQNSYILVDDYSQAKAISRIVSMAANNGFYGGTCLRSSMLVWWFTRREGIHSEICFGVRMIGRQLEAHAWVECNGSVINDRVDIRDFYQPMGVAIPQIKQGL
jgi:hypothetical protein